MWQPIETAPKDGTRILIREKGGRVQVARWADNWGAKDWYVQLTTNGTDFYPTLEVTEWTPIPD